MSGWSYFVVTYSNTRALQVDVRLASSSHSDKVSFFNIHKTGLIVDTVTCCSPQKEFVKSNKGLAAVQEHQCLAR